MPATYQQKIEVVSNYIVSEFDRFTVNKDADYDSETVQHMYNKFQQIVNKVIKDKRFEPRIVNESSHIAKKKILEKFAEYLI